MATALSSTLADKDFINWLKGALAILFAKEGMTDFVSTEISLCHNNLLQLVPTANVLKSCSCTIKSLPKCVSHRPHQHSILTSGNTQLCSRGVCHVLMDGICQNHRYRGPSWKNTDTQKWCTNSYEIAKCYMPPDGYANKSSMAETDFNGILAVIINNKSFQMKLQAVLSIEPNICTKARDVGRAIRHTADHLLSDSDLHRYIDDLINLLCDSAYLLKDPIAQVAVGKLKQLKANTLNIFEHDITEVLNENIRETFSEQQQQYLQAIQNHFSQLQTDSIVEIERLVSIKKRELEEFTGEKKEEIIKHVEAQTHDFSLKKKKLGEFTSKKKEEITKQVEAQIQDLSVKKTELEEFTSEKKEQITKHFEAQTRDFSVKKTELDELICKKKEEITKHVEAQTQDLSVKKTELEAFTSKKKEEITKHVEAQTQDLSVNKTELEEFTSMKKEEITKHVEAQTQDLSVKKTELEEFTSKKKEEITKQVEAQSQDLSVKKTELDELMSKKKKEITKHVEAQTQDFSVKKTELEEFTSKQKEDITRHVDIKTQEIETCVLYQREQYGKSDEDKQEALRDDLITYYRKNESAMPFYPLVEEHDVQLMDFYVRPPISLMEKNHIFTSFKTNEQSSFNQEEENEHFQRTLNNNAPDGTDVCSYSDLFFQEHCEPFANIYVTADAGMGKTALSKHITMHWCQSNKPDLISDDKYKKDDIETMKQFKFLFLLHLRDVHGSQTCDLDDLIYDLCKELSRKSLYSKEFLENILHDQRCLVILDGLDEWAHPSKCRKTPKVPHHNHPHTCTVLTTTRPWTLCTAGLSSTHIDRHALIGEFDYERSRELELNAFEILKRIPSATVKCIEDFYKAVESIGDICNNPYIKLHLMCLWYEGGSIGTSKCEIYSNITELTLKRGLKKRDLPSIKALQSDVTHALPKCFEKNNKSRKYTNLLFKLGKLAFFSLFSEIKESVLIIDSETVLKYLNNREQQFCLKVGLLCQIKEVNQLVKISHKVYFQHKSIQEFFSALYIQGDWGNTLVPSTIFKICKSLPEVLEMSDVFVFVCGMNPEVYSDLFKQIQCVIERDQITCSYRTLIPGQEHIIRAYQSMQVSCIEENIKNKNGECCISVQDIFLDEFNSVLYLILLAISGQIKSCYISDMWVTLKNMMSNKNILENRTNENTIAEHANVMCTIENAISRFEQHITATVQTLRIHSVLFNNLQSTFLSGCVGVLKYLSISDLTVSADDLDLLYAFLCKTNILTCLYVQRICVRDRFLDSRSSNTDNSTSIVLDLSLHFQLQTLYMTHIPNLDLLLNTEVLQHCELEEFSLLHDNIYKLFASIGSGRLIDKITLHTIKCLNHKYNQWCPGVPLKMCQGSQLRTLDLNGLSLDVLDLSQSRHLQKIELLNISLHELRIDTERLQICKLKFRKSLPNKCLNQIFSSIESGEMLEELSLSTELCQDHPISCPGVKLNLSKHCNLQKLLLSNIEVHTLELAEGNKLQILSLINVPINKIDLFRSNHLRTINLSNVPLRELTLNADCLEYCTMQTELLLLSHDSINKLANSIGRGTMLKQLAIKQIQCLDHFQSCPGVPLIFCNNSKIWEIDLCTVPIRVLDISQSCQVNTIVLKNIPLCKIHTTTKYFSLCTFEAELSKELPHSTIYQLLCFIGSCKMLKQLTLKQIQCSDHEDSCPGVSLTFCKNSQIQQLTVSRLSLDVLDLSRTCQVEKIFLQDTSLCELHTSTKFLKVCTLEAEFSVELPHTIIHKFLCSIGNCMMLTNIALKQIQCLEHPDSCAGVPLVFCTRSQLQHITVFKIPISALDLSQSNQVETIKLQNAPLCDLHTNTNCLNLCTLEADLSVELSHTTICQLLCSIGNCIKLKNINFTQIHCLDHPYSCPGAPLKFGKNSQLQQLTIAKIPLSMLDLSQSVRVITISLQNIPLCELHTSNQCLQSCKLHAELSTELPHTTIQQLLCSIGGCMMLTDITLTQIKCSDHPGKCPGTKMTFCKDSQLQRLSVEEVPLSVLDLSQTGQVEMITLSNIPLRELQTSAEVLQSCVLHASMLMNMSHNNLQQLFNSIEGCKALTKINVHYIKCSDHPGDCPGVPLTFCENSQLRHITMFRVPLSVLDLSKTSHLRTICLRDIPIRQLHGNTNWLNSCTLETELSVALPHTIIQEFLCSIGSCSMLSNIAIEQIRCLDHLDSCPGVPLTFCKNSKLQKLTVISVPLSVLDISQTGQVNTIQLRGMPLRELHTISNCLQQCILDYLSLPISHNTIQKLLCSIGSCMTLSNLTVNDIRCSDHSYDCLGVPLTICKNSNLQQLTVSHVPISLLDLSQTCQVKTIKIQNIPLCELNINADCLHLCTLEAILSFELSHNSIRQLFSSIGKCIMLSDITLVHIQCSDHPGSCSNVPLTFCENSQLQHLDLFEVPVSVLDISQSDQVKTIKLKNIPLCEIRMNTECLQLCTLDADLSATLSHKIMEHLLRSIGSCKMLTHITLKDIKCSDHPYSCPGVPLIFVKSSEVFSLSLCSVPVSGLDLSQTGPVEKIQLRNIPLCELHTNTACLNSCTLEADLSVKVPHNTIQKLLRSIGSCVMLTYIILKNIQCSDHLNSCPGVQLTFGKHSELIWLTIYSVPVNVLDLTQAVKVKILKLQDIPLVELHTNSEYVSASTLKADMTIMLSQSNIHQFYLSIGRGKMFEELTIYNTMVTGLIRISSGVPLKMCQNSQLRKLTLKCLAFSALDLSHTSEIEELQLSGTFMNELYINTDHLQIFELVCTPLSHKCIQKVFSTIESGAFLKQIIVRYIWCIDHPESCTGVDLNLSRNDNLQTLSLSNVQVSALDLPKFNQLNKLCELHTNSDGHQPCTLEVDLSVKLPHINLQKLFSSIGNCIMFSKITLKHVQCLDHPDICPGVPLMFCKNSNLQQLCAIKVPISALDLSNIDHVETIQLQNTPLCELHTNIECFQVCKLEADFSVILSHNIMQKLFNSIGDCINIKELNLKQIQCSDHTCSCPGVPLKFCPNSILQHLSLSMVPLCLLDLSHVGQLQELHLENIPLNEIKLSQADLKRLQLQNVTLPFSAWREMFLSLGNLPLLKKVDLYMINMSASEWKELLTLMYSGTLAHNIRLLVASCVGPSTEEWGNILTELKTLSVTANFWSDRYLFYKNLS